MSELVPRPRRDDLISVALGESTLADRRASRARVAVERQTLVRLARVQAHGLVQAEKEHEIDQLAREAMTGQAMLSKWGATLAQDDPFLQDDCKFFSDMAKMGKGEILADSIADFCREGRLW
jgi:hypothetical protein